MLHHALFRVLALGVSLSAGGQEPIPVTLAELHRHPSRFHEREILVRGELGPGRTSFDEMYLRDQAYSVALVGPVAAGSDRTFLLSRRVEVRGTFRDHSMQAVGEGWKRYGRFVILAKDIAEAPEESPDAEPEEELEKDRSAPGPEAPPEIVSIAPSAGRRDLHPSTVFEIRFSAAMDETTFEGNVWLRLGDIGREPSAFVPALFTYDPGTRTLTLKPLEPLPLLKQVSLSLYRGIAGADGQPLRVVPQSPKSIQSRRGALQAGADLRELVVLTFVTRGY